MMNRLLILLLIASSAANAQVFQVDTLFKNGPLQDRINLVFMGDGYTATEQAKYITDVNEILDELFNQVPFKHYKNYFNAFAIKVVSEESGANHPKTTSDPDCTTPVAVVNNYFGSTFDYQGIHRLLYPTNLTRVINVLSTNFPLYDQAFIAVNSPYYGGAGGFIATCSDHTNGKDVAIHEIGHSFAGLADEYWAGAIYASEKPNMTKQSSADLIKWKNWLGVSGVGIHPHSVDASWKKPHTNCKMGVLNAPLCKVCSETFVERFHQLVNPINSFTPSQTSLIMPENEIEFSVSLALPQPNTLKVVWEKNNEFVAKGDESVSFTPAELADPSVIRVTVRDTSELTRSDTHITNHVYVVEWQLASVVTGVEIIPVEKQYKIAVFPNPASDLKIEFTLSTPELVDILLIDLEGKKIKSLVNSRLNPGEHAYHFLRNELGKNSGEYVLQFTFGQTIISEKIVIR